MVHTLAGVASAWFIQTGFTCFFVRGICKGLTVSLFLFPAVVTSLQLHYSCITNEEAGCCEMTSEDGLCFDDLN